MRRAPILAALSAALTLTSGARAGVTPGERTFIDQTLTVPTSVLTYLGGVFPEAVAMSGPFISASYDPNLTIVEQATVSVTFLWEGAGYRNAFGYFTYDSTGAGIVVHDAQLIFPNASFADPTKGWGGGQLLTGDTVTLRDADGNVRIFQPGSHIGFFVVSDGWNGSAVRGWGANSTAIPDVTAAANALNRTVTTIDALNPANAAGRPDLARQTVVARVTGSPGFLGGADFLVIGFEDKLRAQGSDHDFNDVMFLVQSTPETAIVSNIPTVDPNNPDPDGDGVSGTADAFPHDAERAFSVRTPATGLNSIAFEDNYPALGDYDFNDAVVALSNEVITRADGKIKELIGSYHLIARGARFDAAFGVGINGVPVDLSGVLEIERYSSAGDKTMEPPVSLASLFKPLPDGRASLRLDQLFPSTTAALPVSGGGLANTFSPAPMIPPASVRFRVVFDAPIDASALAAPPYDLFLLVVRGADRYDIHTVGALPFLGRPSSLPAEGGKANFLDAQHHPFAMLLPAGWQYPLERVPIGAADPAVCAYPRFDPWRTSQGKNDLTWYLQPNTTAPSPRVIGSLMNAVYARSWTLNAGG